MSAAKRKLYNELAVELIEHMKHIPDAEHIIRGYFQERMDREAQAEQEEMRQKTSGPRYYYDEYAGVDPDLYEKIFGSSRASGKQSYSYQYTKTAKNPFEELFREAYYAAGGTKTAKPKKKAVDPKERRIEIENELDIIRGVVPTPKGYKINPANVKSLMKELKELENA